VGPGSSSDRTAQKRAFAFTEDLSLGWREKRDFKVLNQPGKEKERLGTDLIILHGANRKSCEFSGMDRTTAPSLWQNAGRR